MTSKWDKYSRIGLDVVSTATTLGFSAAKAGTKLGFSITKGVASTAAGVTGSAVDHVFFGGNIGAGPMLGGAVSTAISTIESLALAPILIGESLTSTSLVAAQSALSALSTIFPGSDEASFSLVSFVSLVRREWSEPVERDGLPEERYGVTKIMKALAGWATLQGVTSRWQEQRWCEYMEEIQVYDEVDDTTMQSAADKESRDHVSNEVHIKSDVIFPRHGGQIVTADIGEASSSDLPSPMSSDSSRRSNANDHVLMSNAELKHNLRRLSKLVLAGYGGPSLLFFGVSPWSTACFSSKAENSTSEKEKNREEAQLNSAVTASEAEAASTSRGGANAKTTDVPSEPDKPAYSWWNVLMGKHDREIFLQYASEPHPENSGVSMHPPTAPRPPTAVVGSENMMPRFWVVTDHARHEVVLVIRGTMSLNELAVDLTCDTAPFKIPGPRPARRQPQRSQTQPEVTQDDEEPWSEFEEELENIPGSFPIDFSTPPPLSPRPVKRSQRQNTVPLVPSLGHADDQQPEDDVYHVHGGMLKMARAMGSPGKPVHVAVRDALRRNRGYSLILCGHSLGAGVAALLALMWADPHTRLTYRHSGLPQRRLVSAYCLAPPCLTCPELGKLAGASGLIISFVYGQDVVSRLSLGSVRDLTRCAAWLCQAEVAHGEGFSEVTKRALRWKAGHGEEGDEEWFIAMRKTLEANMHMTQLYPPGRVLWAMRDGDLHPAHRLPDSDRRLTENSRGERKVRLFEVQDVERVFGQIVFARDMLSSHLPHQYDRVLHELF